MSIHAEPLAIEDYALIGDCQTAALVGRNGSIDWLCWPDFDSDACFASLLGKSSNGRWLIAPASQDVRISRSYQGATMILETVFETAEGTVALIDFMPTDGNGPAVIRRVEGRKGHVVMRMHLALRFEYGFSTPWVTKLKDGNGIQAVAGSNRVVLRTDIEIEGSETSSEAEFNISEGQVRDFVLSWSRSHLEVPRSFDLVHALARTKQFWIEWTSRFVYQGNWRDQVLRSLITLKALSFSQTGAIVAAPTTSLPELLGGSRNWDYRFCWLRDAALTLLAFMGSGYVEEAVAWRNWLSRAVAGNPDELQIMYSIGGDRRLIEWEATWLPGYQGSSPVRIGNAASGQLQLDTFGEVTGALSIARRNGLKDAEEAWAMQVRFLEHLERIWEQPDDGIWEVRGGRREFTHSKVMAWSAIDSALRDAEEFGLEAPLDRWRRLRSVMHATICDRGFDHSRNCFVQSFGGTALDASLLTLPLVNFLPADDPRIIGTVRAIEDDLMVDGFLLRYRTEEGHDGLPPGEGVFLPCSFWLARVYKLQGRGKEAQDLFERLLALCNDVGLLSEEYDSRSNRQLGNFPQAFSHLELVVTALALNGSDMTRRGFTGWR